MTNCISNLRALLFFSMPLGLNFYSNHFVRCSKYLLFNTINETYTVTVMKMVSDKGESV